MISSVVVKTSSTDVTSSVATATLSAVVTSSSAAAATFAVTVPAVTSSVAAAVVVTSLLVAAGLRTLPDVTVANPVVVCCSPGSDFPGPSLALYITEANKGHMS